MNILVFGATGTIGAQIIEQSLAKGYSVTGFCRNPDALPITHPSLTLIQGDVINPGEVQRAVKNHEVVVIALGSGKKRDGTVRSEGTRNIIAAMKANTVKRLICMTTLGCGDSNSHLTFFWKRIMFGWFLKKVFLDHELQEEYVKNSGLDWTIIRPGAFTNGAKTGIYRHGFDANERKLQLKISRADVADFILKQSGSNLYLYKAPGLSY